MLRNLGHRFQKLTVGKRWTVGVASVVALILIGASFYFVYPYGQICRQAKDATHENCATYHILFVALWHINKSLTDYAASITVVATVAIAAFTATLWWTTKATLKHLSREFQAEHRPWVTLDCALAGLLTCTDNVWSVDITYSIRNIGNSPATNVAFWAGLMPYFDTAGDQTQITDIKKELDKVCLFPEMVAVDESGLGALLFPQEPRTGERPLYGVAARFKDAKAHPDGYSGNFLVLVCTTYGSTFKMARYRTAKAFLVAKLAGGKISLSGDSIRAEHLAFLTKRSYAE